MDIRVTYRPFTGTISAYNTVDDTMSDYHRLMIEEVFRCPEDDDWWISLSKISNTFHHLVVIGSQTVGQGLGWTLFVSDLIDEKILTAISGTVDKWNTLLDHPACKYTDWPDKERILKRFVADITVEDEE